MKYAFGSRFSPTFLYRLIAQESQVTQTCFRHLPQQVRICAHLHVSTKNNRCSIWKHFIEKRLWRCTTPSPPSHTTVLPLSSYPITEKTPLLCTFPVSCPMFDLAYSCDKSETRWKHSYFQQWMSLVQSQKQQSNTKISCCRVCDTPYPRHEEEVVG